MHKNLNNKDQHNSMRKNFQQNNDNNNYKQHQNLEDRKLKEKIKLDYKGWLLSELLGEEQEIQHVDKDKCQHNNCEKEKHNNKELKLPNWVMKML